MACPLVEPGGVALDTAGASLGPTGAGFGPTATAPRLFSGAQPGHEPRRVPAAPSLHVARECVDPGEVGLDPDRVLVRVQADVVVHALREAVVHLPGARVQPVEGLDGAGVRLAGREVGVQLLGAQVAGEDAAARHHGHRDRGAVGLRLHVAEPESHRLEVVGEDVGDAVFGAVDLDALNESGGGVGGGSLHRGRADRRERPQCKDSITKCHVYFTFPV